MNITRVLVDVKQSIANTTVKEGSVIGTVCEKTATRPNSFYIYDNNGQKYVVTVDAVGQRQPRLFMPQEAIV
jgi:hypothetical protein